MTDKVIGLDGKAVRPPKAASGTPDQVFELLELALNYCKHNKVGGIAMAIAADASAPTMGQTNYHVEPGEGFRLAGAITMLQHRLNMFNNGVRVDNELSERDE